MPEYTIIISCEHGGNKLPEAYTALAQGHGPLLASHRGWDHGALLVAKELASLLDAPLFFTTISRLLIDTNRSLPHRNLFSEISRHLPANEKRQIVEHYYLPHRQKISEEIQTLIDSGSSVLHLAVHSFTPVLAGVKRNADLGLLYDSKRPKERLLCQVWQIALKNARPDLTSRRNYPYRGQSDGLPTSLRQKFPTGRYLGIEVEINQRHFGNRTKPAILAKLLAHTLQQSLSLSSPPVNSPHPPNDELVAIVDINNNFTGQATRQEMRRLNLIHRATYILVFNNRGELFVQKRTKSKDIYPGFLDVAAGGVVQAGESYEESAHRELLEELGITAELQFLFDRYFADGHNTVWGRVYRCQHDGPFVLQESEVESGFFMPLEAIMTASDHPFTPDGLAILAEIINREGARIHP